MDGVTERKRETNIKINIGINEQWVVRQMDRQTEEYRQAGKQTNTKKQRARERRGLFV